MLAKQSAWNARDYEDFQSSVPAAGEILIELLKPLPGEFILDVGCGNGTITSKVQLKGAYVIGVDSSEEMVAVAKTRGIDAQLLNAENLPFEGVFDAVYSHAVLHWVKDTEKAVSSIVRALKTGGRFVAEFGIKGNIEVIESSLAQAVKNAGYDPEQLSPWRHLTQGTYQALFERQGLEIEFMRQMSRKVPLTGGMSGWLNTFARQFLLSIPSDKHEAILREAEDLMRPSLLDESGVWHADYKRMWVTAIKVIPEIRNCSKRSGS